MNLREKFRRRTPQYLGLADLAGRELGLLTGGQHMVRHDVVTERSGRERPAPVAWMDSDTSKAVREKASHADGDDIAITRDMMYVYITRSEYAKRASSVFVDAQSKDPQAGDVTNGQVFALLEAARNFAAAYELLVAQPGGAPKAALESAVSTARAQVSQAARALASVRSLRHHLGALPSNIKAPQAVEQAQRAKAELAELGEVFESALASLALLADDAREAAHVAGLRAATTPSASDRRVQVNSNAAKAARAGADLRRPDRDGL